MALLANDACGSPVPFQMTFPWTYFDGKLFHSKLIKATQARNLVELCDGRVEMAYQVERIRNVIMNGSNFSGKPQMQPGFKFKQQNKPKNQQKKKNNNKQNKVSGTFFFNLKMISRKKNDFISDQKDRRFRQC